MTGRPGAGALSVCIPAYEAERTLEATMDSVLSQDVDMEVLVLDNASADRTGDIARSFHDARVRVVRNDRVLDIGANWNAAVRASTGALVKVVCADDLLRPGALVGQCAFFDDADVAVVASRFEVIDEGGAVKETGLGLPGLLGRRHGRELAGVIVRRGPAEFGPTAAATFRRDLFDLVGGFRGDLVFPMDVDLFARIGAHGAFHGIASVDAAWRDSTFNLCSRTSSYSKLTELVRLHHRLGSELPELVTAADVLAGDTRILLAAMTRLRIRAAGVTEQLRRREHAPTA